MTGMPFHTRVEALSGQTISQCFQCFRCTSGCPVAEEMDLYPHRLIEEILAGEKKRVLMSRAIWTCLQCSTCTVRCPNGIDVAAVFETLRMISHGEGMDSEHSTWLFDSLMTESIRKHGRLFELGVAARYKCFKGGLLKNPGMGLAMARRCRLNLLPHRLRKGSGFREMIRRLKTGSPQEGRMDPGRGED